MLERQDSTLLLTYNGTAPAPEIAIASEDDIKAFGTPWQVTHKHSFALIFENITEAEIAAACSIINNQNPKLRAELVGTERGIGIQINSDTQTKDDMATALLRVIQHVRKSPGATPQPEPSV